MRKLLATIALLATVTISNALEWQTCLEYITRDDPSARWELKGKKVDGVDVVKIARWQSSVAQPTQEQLEAIEPTAIAWKTNETQTEEANFDDWSEREKAMLKYLIKQINQLRAKHGEPALTGTQVKAGIKAEM